MEIIPCRDYFRMQTGILVARQICGLPKYYTYYYLNRSELCDAYSIINENDFLDVPDKIVAPMVCDFQEDVEILNRGKLWNGSFQVSLDKWMKKINEKYKRKDKMIRNNLCNICPWYEGGCIFLVNEIEPELPCVSYPDLIPKLEFVNGVIQFKYKGNIRQRKPREDQIRDQDCIRRYEVGADIDGDTAVLHIDENVLTIHEPKDTEFKSPKFKFVFRNEGDLRTFIVKLLKITDFKGRLD